MPDRDARLWLRAARSGDFASAWSISDRIRARTTNRGDPTLPRHLQQIWDGTPVEGRRVLVRCYHGLGDTIQFARYLPALRAIAREVIVWAQPTLLDLLATLPAPVTLLPLHDGAPEVAYDVDLEIMELPYVFRTTLETIPAEVPYLSPPVVEAGAVSGTAVASRQGLSARENGKTARPRIGLVWRGGDWNARRSIPFRQLAPLFAFCDAEWWSLQGDRRAGEHHAELQWPNVDSIAHLATLMQQGDLVISIDSMTAHLAGALGVPVWTLLPYRADWRWFRHRSDTPWYPTMRLFRQARPGAWDGVIGEVARQCAAARTPLHR
jgi:hypothetical protein